MTNYTMVVLPYGTLPKDVVDLGTTFGPFFLAQCFNWALYGVLTLQLYIYWLRFPKDLRYIKVLVYSVFVLDTFFIILITHAAWRVLVSYWGDVNILHELDWTWATLPISSGVVSMIVQLFFVYRIWKLSKKFTMPFIIAMVTVAQCVFAFKTGVLAYHVRTFHYIRDLLPGFWLGGSMLADILICVTLVHILWNSQTGFKDTDSVVARLMRLTIEAAAIPVVVAAIKLGLIYAYHDNRHLVFCVCLARLYSNSLLAMLNCRDPLFGGGIQPNTLAGAARLVDSSNGRSGFFLALKSKLTFSGNHTSRASSEYETRISKDQLSSVDGEKILIRQSTVRNAHHDVDLEAARRSDISTRRFSNFTLDSINTMSEIKHASSDVGMTRDLTAAWLGPSSEVVIPGFGTYETRSELVGSDGRKLAIRAPTPEATLASSAPPPDSNDIFPGR